MEQIYIKLRHFFNGLNKVIDKIPGINRDLIQLQPLLPHMDHHLDEILEIYTSITNRLLQTLLSEENRIMELYQSQLQHYEAKLRNQVAIGIELRMYYQQLQNRIEEQRIVTDKLRKTYISQLEMIHRQKQTKSKNKTPEAKKHQELCNTGNFTTMLNTQSLSKRKKSDTKIRKRSLSIKSVNPYLQNYSASKTKQSKKSSKKCK